MSLCFYCTTCIVIPTSERRCTPWDTPSYSLTGGGHIIVSFWAHTYMPSPVLSALQSAQSLGVTIIIMWVYENPQDSELACSLYLRE